MSNKRVFQVEQLEGWGLPYGGPLVDDHVIDTDRWSEHHWLYFNALDDGLLWRVPYSKGLTEMQDERPWEYEDSVEGVRVEPYERTITDYREVEGRSIL